MSQVGEDQTSPRVNVGAPQPARGMKFAQRQLLTLLALNLLTILVISVVIFYNIVSSGTAEVRERAGLVSQSYAEQFNEWMHARTQEVQLLSQLSYSQEAKWQELYPVMEALALSSPYFDSIIMVDASADAQVGLTVNNGRPVRISDQQLSSMSVPDREWFQRARQGNLFIQPPIESRATGNLVATIAVPVMYNNQVVGVMTGSVRMNALIERVQAFERSQGVEIFILDQEGAAISPSASIDQLGQPLQSQAADFARQQQSAVQRYANAIGNPVVGSVSNIPSLAWSMVMEIATEQAWESITQMFWTLVWLSIAVLAIAAAASWWLVQRLERILGGDPDHTAQIVAGVASGNLCQEIQLRPQDNNSLLAAIEQMQQGLRKMLANIGDYATQVSAAATELAQINQESEQGVAKQTDDIRGAATAMTQMSSTLQEVASNTQQAAHESRAASSSAEHSRAKVNEAVSAMKSLVTEIQQSASIIDQLKSNSDQVGGILEVIESIAEQTNLLALNAAIEAARAGDSGRGFAVVADEVRNLAGRTKESTTEIQSKIDGLQKGAEQAVQAMQGSAEGSDQTMSLVQNMDQALLDIITKVQTIDQYAMQIASATEEQTQVAHDINQNMNSINDVAEQTQERVQQSAEASRQMSQLAEQLQSLLQGFKY